MPLGGTSTPQLGFLFPLGIYKVFLSAQLSCKQLTKFFQVSAKANQYIHSELHCRDVCTVRKGIYLFLGTCPDSLGDLLSPQQDC